MLDALFHTRTTKRPRGKMIDYRPNITQCSYCLKWYTFMWDYCIIWDDDRIASSLCSQCLLEILHNQKDKEGKCDPKFFVICGFCGKCNRRCEHPLFDPNGDSSLLDWDEMRINWNTERSDLMLDAIKRMCEKEGK